MFLHSGLSFMIARRAGSSTASAVAIFTRLAQPPKAFWPKPNDTAGLPSEIEIYRVALREAYILEISPTPLATIITELICPQWTTPVCPRFRGMGADADFG